jgi:hypothetical protein
MARSIRRNPQYRLSVVSGPCVIAFNKTMTPYGSLYVLLLPIGEDRGQGAIFYNYALAAERAIKYWDDDELADLPGMEREDAYGCAGFVFDGDKPFAQFVENLAVVAERNDEVGKAASDLRRQILALAQK